MNERIRAHAEEAGIKFEAHPQHLGIDTAVITPADLERFAESIVRECAKVAFNFAPTAPAAFDIHHAVIKHFRVDE